MIGKLTGQIISIYEDHLILDVNGVGYLVYMSTLSLKQLVVNNNISLFIETNVREDNITLFGFITFFDKNLFNLLKTVQGVGPKLSLVIMSLESEVVLNAIMLDDSKKLCSISGVGVKVAARIINELKDKVIKMVGKGHIENIHKEALKHTSNNVTEEALLALKSLGYSDKAAEEAINYVLKNGSKIDLKIEDIVKQSLNYFSANQR